MAPWYPGATPTGIRWLPLGVRDNNDAFYTCLNDWNNPMFRYFEVKTDRWPGTITSITS